MDMDKDKKTQTDLCVPRNYILCFLSECSASKDCARFFAGRNTGERKLATVVLPAAVADGKCEWFHRLRKINGAWGFDKLFDGAKLKDAPSLRKSIKEYLGGNGTYYLYQHGKKLLKPEQQEWIIALFRQYGYADGLEFDGYREVYDW